MEIWKEIKNYEGLYEISSLGNVKSLDDEGYFHEEFLKQSDITKNDKTLKLCNIINEMSLASHFIGSNDANLSAFICLLRKGKNITDLRDGGLIIY